MASRSCSHIRVSRLLNYSGFVVILSNMTPSLSALRKLRFFNGVSMNSEPEVK